MKKKNT